MTHETAETISIVCASLFFVTFFGPLVFLNVGPFVLQEFGQNALFWAVLADVVFYAIVDVLSLVFFLINVGLRVKKSKVWDRMLIINLLLIPIPTMFLLAGFWELMSAGLPAFLFRSW